MREKKKAKAVSPVTFTPKLGNYQLFIALAVITCCVYYSSLGNGFTNWDDDVNVTANTDVRTFHGDSIGYTIQRIFSLDNTVGMYAPLAKLSFCAEYSIFNLDPHAYHFTNFLFHLLNTFLVFALIMLLTNRQWGAFLTALLFSIHPMHVESVAWITGRVDVMYSFFFMIGLCAYTLYIQAEKHKWRFYVIAIVSFVFSLLSKASAVVFPLVLLAVDFLLNRKISFKTISEKLPFFFLSVIFGFFALYAQKTITTTIDFSQYSFGERVLFMFYAVGIYLYKVIVPLNLSCYYSYPAQNNFPVTIFITPLILLAGAFFMYKAAPLPKHIWFGLAFFFINTILILPGFAARDVIVAERYTYLSYVGLFFTAATAVDNLWKQKNLELGYLKKPVIATVTLFCAMFIYLSIERIKVWHDSLSLWNDAIEKFDNACVAYNNRAHEYEAAGAYERAIADYTKAVQCNEKYSRAYFNRGVLYNTIGKTSEAVQDYNLAISLNPDYLEAYNNRGNVYNSQMRYADAIKDFDKAISINPRFADLYCNRGIVYTNLKEFYKAIQDFNTAIHLNSTYAQAYNSRGFAYFNMGRYDLAVEDYNRAIAVNSGYYDAYNNRGALYYTMGNHRNAINDFTTAIKLNPNLASAYSNRAKTYFDTQQFKASLDDILIARNLGFNIDQTIVSMIEKRSKENNR